MQKPKCFRYYRLAIVYMKLAVFYSGMTSVILNEYSDSSSHEPIQLVYLDVFGTTIADMQCTRNVLLEGSITIQAYKYLNS